MVQKRYLYVMISRTDTGIGKVIRRISHYNYNHVALTLDPTFRSWVAFARYMHDAPLYAGFVNEPVERYLAKGEHIDVRIFRVKISEQKYMKLKQLFAIAGEQNTGLVYNYLSVLAAIFGRDVHVYGAYTCLSFACTVLGKQFKTIKALDSYLAPCMIYEGELATLASDSGKRTDTYFTDTGVMYRAWISTKCVAILLSRTVRRDRPDLVTRQLC